MDTLIGLSSTRRKKGKSLFIVHLAAVNAVDASLSHVPPPLPSSPSQSLFLPEPQHCSIHADKVKSGATAASRDESSQSVEPRRTFEPQQSNCRRKRKKEKKERQRREVLSAGDAALLLSPSSHDSIIKERIRLHLWPGPPAVAQRRGPESHTDSESIKRRHREATGEKRLLQRSKDSQRI